MRVLLVGAAFGAVLCAGALWAAETTAQSPQDLVDAREATMKKMGAAVKAGVDMKAPAADAKAKLAEARKIAESIPSLFPKGTGPGDPGVTKTRALPEIWAKPAEFKAAADKLVTLLKAAEAAVDADETTKGTALNATYKGCKGCHDEFRGPEIP